MILNFKSSIQREADRFFKELLNTDFNIREVTKGAFTQARAKLDPLVFKKLNQTAWQTFYNKAPYHTWKNRRVLSVDGTRLLLPNHESIRKEFGVHNFGCKAEAKRSLAIGSILYDPLNQVALDAEIAPFSSNERDLLMKHLDIINPGDVLLLDRGYPCFWLLFLLSAMKIDFCIRLQEKWWLSANEFNASDDQERIVTYSLPKKDYGKLKDFPQIRETVIKCRLVKVTLADGTNEILCTSLLNSQEFKVEEIKELYHYRWNEEEAYKLLKSRIELESFSGKTALAVKQDFYAKVLLLSLTAIYAHPIEEKVRAEYKADETCRKHDQKINRANAISSTQSILIGLLLKKLYRSALDAFDKLVYKTREIIRPNRSNIRKKQRKKPYCMNYKRL